MQLYERSAEWVRAEVQIMHVNPYGSVELELGMLCNEDTTYVTISEHTV